MTPKEQVSLFTRKLSIITQNKCWNKREVHVFEIMILILPPCHKTILPLYERWRQMFVSVYVGLFTLTQS